MPVKGSCTLSVTIGTKLGSYEILSPIGVGGTVKSICDRAR
jgi:hypothetical protein